ncbi:hypothetical protein LS70_009620 [Helicobacter sp. MIT 11-5569]|uniref:hypothetical protein n=1 Tax=Helicobacter sp. MIT 11-5569 TaxID=1548151 RepID=UPI00051FBB79|nr:hypothetical protein [Helicobacter sp. MIT 11-5569]TLD79756.1 hypothetical protein LS70_009620 [Helicobacter sp. MIT 11-5569]
MQSKDLFYQDLQEVFKYYLKNDSYLKGALDGLKQHERRSFISSILSYEYQNLVEDGNLERQKYKVILPKNLIIVLTYDKYNFDGEILANFVEDLEFELQHREMELYDDPCVYGYEEDEEEMDEEEWVQDQVEDIRDFLDALKDFKWTKC